MSQLSSVVLGKKTFAIVAVVVSLGAVQLAFGRDLSASKPMGLVAASASENTINRATKTDRAKSALASPSTTQTISLRLDGMSSTSVLVRVPVAAKSENEARGRAVPSLMKPTDRKMAIACEPSVSVLTDVARQLQPGRCVT